MSDRVAEQPSKHLTAVFYADSAGENVFDASIEPRPLNKLGQYDTYDEALAAGARQLACGNWRSFVVEKRWVLV